MEDIHLPLQRGDLAAIEAVAAVAIVEALHIERLPAEARSLALGDGAPLGRAVNAPLKLVDVALDLAMDSRRGPLGLSSHGSRSCRKGRQKYCRDQKLTHHRTPLLELTNQLVEEGPQLDAERSC